MDEKCIQTYLFFTKKEDFYFKDFFTEFRGVGCVLSHLGEFLKVK